MSLFSAVAQSRLTGFLTSASRANIFGVIIASFCSERAIVGKQDEKDESKGDEGMTIVRGIASLATVC